MSRLHFEEARTEEQFAALSLILPCIVLGDPSVREQLKSYGPPTPAPSPPTSWPGRSPMTAGSPHSGKI